MPRHAGIRWSILLLLAGLHSAFATSPAQSSTASDCHTSDYAFHAAPAGVSLLQAKSLSVEIGAIAVSSETLRAEGVASAAAVSPPGAPQHGQHEEGDSESLSLAYFLMGGVGAMMFVFHLVNSPFAGVRAATWRVLNMTTSIFVAVLLYGTLKNTIVWIIEPSFHTLVAITLVLFIFSFLGLHVILHQLKEGDKLHLQAASTILAHMCGFAAMYGFADVQEVQLLEELEVPGVIILITLVAVSILGLNFLMDWMMNMVVHEDQIITIDEEKWMDTCEEAVDDVFSLAVSFLIVLLLRYLIRGKPQSYHPGHAGNVTQAHANHLLACAFGFGWLVFVGGPALSYMEGSLGEARVRRVAILCQHVNSMVMAWGFLFWAEWQIYVSGWEHTAIGACLLCAVGLTLFSFACVFALAFIQGRVGPGKLSQRALCSLDLAFGVLVGFSWERAFDVGFEQVSLRYESEATGRLWVLLSSTVLFLIVCPAWRLYILPKVPKEEAHK